MSYTFSGTSQKIVGTLTTAVVFPCTIACFVKVTDHPYPSEKVALMLANATATNNDSAKLRTGTAADNTWALRYTDSSAATSTPSRVVAADNTWLPWVGTLASDSFTCYASDETSPGTATTNLVDSAGMTKVHIGEDSSGNFDFIGLIAEVAIWDKVLSSSEVASYCSGTAASSIAAANLRGYWPLNASNSTQSNLGLDSTGDLTVTSATYDADHPTITSLVTYLKILAHASAASATSVEGVVLNSTRDTVIGEFSGQAFEAALESGKAVLKIPTTSISPDGGTLTTSDTPLVVAYNTTKTTPLVSATVIEE